MPVSVSAPGKIYLCGEHFVVYGAPALLSAIDKRVTVKIEDHKDKLLTYSLDNRFIRHIINVVKNHFALRSIRPFKITVASQIKKGYHLGSSAAVSVASIGALLYYLKRVWNPDLVNKLAFEVEKIKHHNASGADNSGITYGGLVWYRKELEFLKSIWQLSLKIPSNLNKFYLIDTGTPLESTAAMVKFVAKKYAENKRFFDRFMAINEIQTKKIALALKEGNANNLVNALKVCENTLEKIGVVSQKVIPIIREVEKKGGAAKILGGGGRSKGVGYLLCFIAGETLLPDLVKRYNFSLEAISLGEEGIRLESSK